MVMVDCSKTWQPLKENCFEKHLSWPFVYVTGHVRFREMLTFPGPSQDGPMRLGLCQHGPGHVDMYQGKNFVYSIVITWPGIC